MTDKIKGKLIYTNNGMWETGSEAEMDKIIKKYPSSKYRFINSEGRVIDEKLKDHHPIYSHPFGFIELDQFSHNTNIRGHCHYNNDGTLIIKKEGE